MVAHILGISAALVSLIAGAIYWVSIVRGETKPSRSAWWIAAFTDAVLVSSYWASGGRETAYLALAFFIESLIAAILSLKYGTKKFDRLDIFVLAGSAISIPAWIIAGPQTAFLLNGLIDMMGAAPNIKKAFKDHTSENTLAWVFTGAAALLEIATLFFLEEINFVIVIFPVYTFILDFLVIIPLWIGDWKKKKKDFEHN